MIQIDRIQHDEVGQQRELLLVEEPVALQQEHPERLEDQQLLQVLTRMRELHATVLFEVRNQLLKGCINREFA